MIYSQICRDLSHLVNRFELLLSRPGILKFRFRQQHYSITVLNRYKLRKHPVPLLILTLRLRLSPAGHFSVSVNSHRGTLPNLTEMVMKPASENKKPQSPSLLPSLCLDRLVNTLRLY